MTESSILHLQRSMITVGRNMTISHHARTPPADRTMIVAIFQGLNDLTDDPDNGALRQQVQKLTADRLDGITVLESKTDTTFSLLNEGTNGVKDCEDQLKTILKHLKNSELEDKLRENDPAGDLEGDLTALGVIRVSITLFLSVNHLKWIRS